MEGTWDSARESGPYDAKMSKIFVVGGQFSSVYIHLSEGISGFECQQTVLGIQRKGQVLKNIYEIESITDESCGSEE